MHTRYAVQLALAGLGAVVLLVLAAAPAGAQGWTPTYRYDPYGYDYGGTWPAPADGWANGPFGPRWAEPGFGPRPWQRRNAPPPGQYWFEPPGRFAFQIGNLAKWPYNRDPRAERAEARARERQERAHRAGHLW
jgi:hypothetical protein